MADNLSNLPEFTVSEISQAVKRTLESNFDRVRVRGEISGFKRATSGHLYFALKDEEAKLDGICHFLPKPIAFDNLGAFMSRLLTTKP